MRLNLPLQLGREEGKMSVGSLPASQCPSRVCSFVVTKTARRQSALRAGDSWPVPLMVRLLGAPVKRPFPDPAVESVGLRNVQCAV